MTLDENIQWQFVLVTLFIVLFISYVITFIIVLEVFVHNYTYAKVCTDTHMQAPVQINTHPHILVSREHMHIHAHIFGSILCNKKRSYHLFVLVFAFICFITSWYLITLHLTDVGRQMFYCVLTPKFFLCFIIRST